MQLITQMAAVPLGFLKAIYCKASHLQYISPMWAYFFSFLSWEHCLFSLYMHRLLAQTECVVPTPAIMSCFLHLAQYDPFCLRIGSCHIGTVYWILKLWTSLYLRLRFCHLIRARCLLGFKKTLKFIFWNNSLKDYMSDPMEIVYLL